MSNPSLRFTALAVLFHLAPSLQAQAAAIPDGQTARQWMVEVDPATFALGGFSAHARLEAAPGSKWVVGAGIYGLDLPKAMVDLDSKNRDEGWKVRLTFGAGLFMDRFLSRADRGLFVGIQVASQRYRLRNPQISPGETQYTSLLVMPRIGYVWRPGNSHLYVMPWMGIGYTDKVSGSAQLADARYHLSHVAAFATVHVGWRF